MTIKVYSKSTVNVKQAPFGAASLNVKLFLNFLDKVVVELFARMPRDGGLFAVQIDFQVLAAFLESCSLTSEPPH